MAIGNKCKFCDVVISSNKYGAFCSGKCKWENSKQNKNNIKCVCERCEKEFYCIPSHISKFCSYECRKVPKDKVCEECGAHFKIETVKQKNRRFCSVKCARGGEKSHFWGMKGELSYTYGQTPWTKGKSAKTDEKLADLGKKISITLKEKFANGEIDISGEKNPNFGNRWSDEQKENASVRIIHRLLDKERPIKNPKFDCGYHFSDKMTNSEKSWYRSSLERRVMVCFDIDETVKSYNHEPFSIKYKNIKRYLPDFTVEYIDGSMSIIECKPSFQLVLNDVKEKIAAAEVYCEERDWKFKVMTLEDIIEYEKNLNARRYLRVV